MTTTLRARLCIALVLPVVAIALAIGTTSAAEATPDHYKPTSGVTFNNPYGGTYAAHRIVRKLVRTINSVKKGHKIRIATWNFRSNAITNALIAAHRRGVSVRVIMDYSNWNPDVPNNFARRAHIQLARGNKHRQPNMTSWLRRCHGSCRGMHGIAHTKFYTFDQVQSVKDVVMYGSANATELAASIQWNDIYTLTNGEEKYDEFTQVFSQMQHDQKAKQPYEHFQHGPIGLDFYPYRGQGTSKDPVLTVLNNIRCLGATGHAGINGHTKIRIAQTATYGPRGLAIANRLATMERRGCNIRIVYAMFGRQALKIMRGAHIPLTHLAYDADCNGIYDKYVHMKSMTVSGVYGANTHARITWDGSANWTAVSLASDEIVGQIQEVKVTAQYAGWIDYLFTHVPPSWKPNHCVGVIVPGSPGSPGSTDRAGSHLVTGGSKVSLTTPERARMLGVDPYALIRRDL